MKIFLYSSIITVVLLIIIVATLRLRPAPNYVKQTFNEKLNVVLIKADSCKKYQERIAGIPEGWIFTQLIHYCDSFNVPPKLIYEMGMNESGWRNPNDSNFVMPPLYVPTETSYGDLQMINPTWRYWKKQLGLKEKTRKNLLIACIAYVKYCYFQGESDWKKARYIYARGKWKPEIYWTPLEKRFMNKIDFTRYDS